MVPSPIHPMFSRVFFFALALNQCYNLHLRMPWLHEQAGIAITCYLVVKQNSYVWFVSLSSAILARHFFFDFMCLELWSKQHGVDMFSHVSDRACFKRRYISRRNRITTRGTPATGLMFKTSQSYSHYFNMCKTKSEYQHVPSKHCCGLQWTSNIKLDQYGRGSKLLPSNASLKV